MHHYEHLEKASQGRNLLLCWELEQVSESEAADFCWDKAQTETLNESKLQFVREHIPDCESLSSWHFICISWATVVTHPRWWGFKWERETALAKDVGMHAHGRACSYGYQTRSQEPSSLPASLAASTWEKAMCVLQHDLIKRADSFTLVLFFYMWYEVNNTQQPEF